MSHPFELSHDLSIKLESGVDLELQTIWIKQTDIMGQITRRVLAVQDEMVRQHLIRLGWTPPCQYANSQDAPVTAHLPA